MRIIICLGVLFLTSYCSLGQEKSDLASFGQIRGLDDIQGFYQVNRKKIDKKSGDYSIRLFDGSDNSIGLINLPYDSSAYVSSITNLNGRFVVALENGIGWELKSYNQSFELLSEKSSPNLLDKKKINWIPPIGKAEYVERSQNVVIDKSAFLYLKSYYGKFNEENSRLVQRFKLYCFDDKLNENWTFGVEIDKQTSARIVYADSHRACVVVKSFEEKGKSCNSFLYVLDSKSGKIISEYELMSDSGEGHYISQCTFDEESKKFFFFGNYYEDSKKSIYQKSQGISILEYNITEDKYSQKEIAWEEISKSIKDEGVLNSNRKITLGKIKFLHEVLRLGESNYCVVVETFNDVGSSLSSQNILYVTYNSDNGEYSSFALSGTVSAKLSFLYEEFHGSAQMMASEASELNYFSHCYSTIDDNGDAIFVSLFNPIVLGSGFSAKKPKNRKVNIVKLSSVGATFSEVEILTKGNCGVILKGEGKSYLYQAELFRVFPDHMSLNFLGSQVGQFDY